MTRSLVASGRWLLTPATLLLETIRAGDCGRPRRVVAQTRGRPRQVLLYSDFFYQIDNTTSMLINIGKSVIGSNIHIEVNSLQCSLILLFAICFLAEVVFVSSSLF